MKQIKVWIDRGDGWELLNEGPERIKVEFDPKDQEASMTWGYLFDPNAPDCDVAPVPPRLEIVG